MLLLAITVASWGHGCHRRRRHWGGKRHWGRRHHYGRGRRAWGRGSGYNSSAHGSAHHGYAASKAGKHGAAAFGAGHGVRTGAHHNGKAFSFGKGWW